jgi:hypothetical protein
MFRARKGPRDTRRAALVFGLVRSDVLTALTADLPLVTAAERFLFLALEHLLAALILLATLLPLARLTLLTLLALLALLTLLHLDRPALLALLALAVLLVLLHLLALALAAAVLLLIPIPFHLGHFTFPPSWRASTAPAANRLIQKRKSDRPGSGGSSLGWDRRANSRGACSTQINPASGLDGSA